MATKRERGGGACEVLPIQKGGGGKSFSHAEGGAQRVLGLFLHSSLKFSHIEGGGTKRGGGANHFALS